MKKIITLLLLSVSLNSFADTDTELNTAYQSAIKRIPEENGNITLEGLKQSQSDWLKYRNSQCALISNTLHIFSDEEAKKNEACIADLNTKRTDFLNKFYLE